MTASDKTKDGGLSLRDPHRATETPVVSGHTPGPWMALPNYQHGPVVKDPDGSFIADFTVWSDAPEEAEANARLIAAAPDLLEELADARTTLSILRTQVMVEIGRCADPSESRWEGVPEKLRERLSHIDAAIAKATTAPETVSVGMSEANAPSLPTGDA